MERISNNLLSNNFLSHIHRQEEGMKNIQNKLAAHTKNLLPEDDPVSVAQFMKERTQSHELDRFQRNINFSKGRVDKTEASLRSLNEILQRARELSIQAANGTYSKEDRYNMALEANQLLEQSLVIANEQYQGTSLFGGTNTEKHAFNIERAAIIDPNTGRVISDSQNIVKVDYQGDNSYRFAELGRGEYVQTNLLGTEAFASQNQSIVSSTDSSNYISTQDEIIRIDGKDILIKQGDNSQAIVDKINSAGINVHASIDNTTGENLVTLESSLPHQIALEDINGSTVLRDLGLTAGSETGTPNHYSPMAKVFHTSVFDELIRLRDGLYHNNSNKINQSIGGLDESLNNILNHTSKIGALQSRLENSENKIAQQQLYTGEVIAKLNDLDVPDSIVKLKNWEAELQTSLQIGAKLLPTTLLSYLR